MLKIRTACCTWHENTRQGLLPTLLHPKEGRSCWTLLYFGCRCGSAVLGDLNRCGHSGSHRAGGRGLLGLMLCDRCTAQTNGVWLCFVRHLRNGSLPSVGGVRFASRVVIVGGAAVLVCRDHMVAQGRLGVVVVVVSSRQQRSGCAWWFLFCSIGTAWRSRVASRTDSLGKSLNLSYPKVTLPYEARVRTSPGKHDIVDIV